MPLTKPGTGYERVVAEILAACSPEASVTQGLWVDGPDGRRDHDVVVEFTTAQGRKRLLIECKDYNPGTTGPVGIGVVEQLESKRRDFDFAHTLVCTNAGFTADAIRKATRVGIGLISVLREGDDRIRFAIKETLYTRRVTIGPYAELTIPGVPPQTQYSADSVRCFGRPLSAWLSSRASMLVAANPIVRGWYGADFELRKPVTFEWPAGSVAADRFSSRFRISGAWFEHQVTLESSTAIYDWVSRRLQVGPSPGTLQFQGIDLYGGARVDLPPPYYLAADPTWTLGDYHLVLVNTSVQGEPFPELEALIAPADLSPLITGLEEDSFVSDPAFDG